MSSPIRGDGRSEPSQIDIQSQTAAAIAESYLTPASSPIINAGRDLYSITATPPPSLPQCAASPSPTSSSSLQMPWNVSAQRALDFLNSMDELVWRRSLFPSTAHLRRPALGSRSTAIQPSGGSPDGTIEDTIDSEDVNTPSNVAAIEERIRLWERIVRGGKIKREVPIG